ncbi:MULTISPECIES: universal stress protein [unclassified Chryseobacterium]|uniref:universal stress protein n=1 Tax=unclassified Chryseobacterium TaxID=2593645 RepID=UPI00226ACF2E|nr:MULTISPECIES: universal stress protein [unclassified Chryseobacterium]
MRTILIPVDASATTQNAVKFAANWAKQYAYEHIILLMVSNESMFDYLHIADPYSVVAEDHVNNVRVDTEALLRNLSWVVKEIVPNVTVSTVLSRSSILRTINESIKENPSVELIVLGADLHDENDDSLVSENIVEIARTSPIRTLIVPNNHSYTRVENVLAPCDITQIGKLERISKFKERLQTNHLKLSLLHIYQKDENLDQEKQQELEKYIFNNFADISTRIYYSQDPNTIKGISSFVAEHPVDIITALPGKHSFLYYLMNRSVTEAIYQNINKPVMILK